MFSLPITSYGVCSIYQAHTEVCDGVLRPSVDSVYAKFSIGSQNEIAELLNNNIKSLEEAVNGHDKDCIKMIFRVLCHYYLPSCGNITHPAPPSSICQEECQMVQDKCKETWNAALVVLHTRGIKPVIDCSDIYFHNIVSCPTLLHWSWTRYDSIK